jgi:hypothetical protein
MSKLLNSVIQAGIVVEDLEATVKYYAEELGIGPWKISRYRDQDGNIVNMLARGWTGGVMNQGFELELFDRRYLMPMQAEFYEKHGRGVQHLSFGCEDFVATREELMKKFPVLFDTCSFMGYSKDMMNSTYFDATKELGIVLEISEIPIGANEGKHPAYQWEEEVYPVKKTV